MADTERKTETVDLRLTPILPEVKALYQSISSKGIEDDVSVKQLTRLGALLTAHTRNIDSTISIGDFLNKDNKMSVEKGQFWHFTVRAPKTLGRNIEYIIEKTDIWNGAGVQIGIQIYKKDRPLFGVFLQNQGLSYKLIALNGKNQLLAKYSSPKGGTIDFKKDN